ncbi:hypothetical protein GcM1_144009 [Golovinomyces cichoracearum]|uniref:Uncharacterized protein n=1 Tax=Golovinomyces cichoracearum TaxID=62708 RepID=A0A420JBL8_9PEZI|nr:hypothetical protein GcM1_144009 [Golovinomyces cichoracearum]
MILYNESTLPLQKPYLTPEFFLEPAEIDQTVTSNNSDQRNYLQDNSNQLLSSLANPISMDPDYLENESHYICIPQPSPVARVNEVSADLNETTILSDNQKRPRKAPRRDICALAGSYESFYTTMATTANNPEFIGRKLPFVSTLKAPPHTWKQMIRHDKSSGFIKAAKAEWNTLLEKETFEMITTKEALQLQEEHQINSLPLKLVFT